MSGWWRTGTWGGASTWRSGFGRCRCVAAECRNAAAEAVCTGLLTPQPHRPAYPSCKDHWHDGYRRHVAMQNHEDDKSFWNCLLGFPQIIYATLAWKCNLPERITLSFIFRNQQIPKNSKNKLGTYSDRGKCSKRASFFRILFSWGILRYLFILKKKNLNCLPPPPLGSIVNKQ